MEEHFPYFEVYKEYEYLQSEDESTDKLKYSFSVSYIGYLYKLEERNYKYDERKKIVENLIKEQTKITELNNMGNVMVFACNPELTLIPKKIKDKVFVKDLLPNIYALRKEHAVIFAQEELSESILLQFLSIPFLFSYQDIYFLPFGQNFFFYVNHHLDLFRVDFESFLDN